MVTHIDSCSVHRGVLIIDGWSSSGPPSVFLRGTEVVAQSYILSRSDLVPTFGTVAENWGFATRCILGSGGIPHHDISIIFPDKECIEAPGVKAQPHSNNLDRMVSNFRSASSMGGRALEIGSRARSGNTYRNLISDNVEYTGIDITDGPNVDIVGDAHHLSLYVQGKFDYIFSISVFEHLLMPWKAALEMNKVMRIGGLAYIQSHPSWPLHEEPWDFWRFSENAWKGIFNKHTGFKVLDCGHDMKARIVPEFATGGHMEAHEYAMTFMLSACLVEKIDDPLVSWEAEVADLYDLSYSHS